MNPVQNLILFKIALFPLNSHQISKYLIYSNWWKYAGTVLVLYSIIGGLLFTDPNNLGILDETIRNLNYHVPMWFAMIALLTISVVNSIMYLRTFNIRYDIIASEFEGVIEESVVVE